MWTTVHTVPIDVNTLKVIWKPHNHSGNGWGGILLITLAIDFYFSITSVLKSVTKKILPLR